MSLTKITSDGITDGTITGTDLATNIDLVDSQRIRIGTSNDLEIFHNGNFNFIVNNNNKNLAIQAKDGENAIVTIPDAEVQLYHNNSLKFETTSYGAAVTGGINFSGDSLVQDNVSIFFGASNDLGIKHDGSNSEIINTTGSLLIDGQNTLTLRSAGNIIGQVNDSETAFQGIANGAVELYHNDVKKFETTSTGITASGTQHIFTSGTSGDCELIIAADSDNNNENDNPRILFRQDGSLTSNSIGVNHPNGNDDNDLYIANGGFSGDIVFYTGYDSNNQNNYTAATQRLKITTDGNVQIPNDSGKIQLGASQDLQIYHDGSHSYIKDAGTGKLRILTNELLIGNVADDENIAKFIENGAVELYHDNSKKFETTSGGATVTGRLSTDGVFIGDGGNNDTSLSIGANNDLRLYHDGTHSYIIDRGTGELRIGSDSGIRLTKHDSETVAFFDPDGAVELYHDNSKKFETTSSGIKITDEIFEIESAASPTIKLTDTANDSDYFIQNDDGTFRIYDSTNSASRLQIASNGDIRIPSDTAKLKFGVGNDLQIYHDGSASYIDNTHSGGLYIRGGSSTGYVVALQAKNSENSVKCIGDGAVELYHDSSKKFNTRSAGIDITGDLRFDTSVTGGIVRLADNQKIFCGTGDDLEIYHNGSNSYIANTFGQLVLEGDDLMFMNSGRTESLARFQNGGSVSLYHDNYKNFEVFEDGLYLDNDAVQNTIYLASQGTTRGYIFAGAGNEVGFKTASNEWGVQVDDQAEVALYYNANKKLETTSTGIDVTGSITVNGSALTSGKILQVKQGALNGTFSTNSTSFVNIGLSEGITPSATDSKILVLVNLNVGSDNNGNRINIRLVRTSDDNILVGTGSGNRQPASAQVASSNGEDIANVHLSHLDSPSTTSAITYQIQCKVQSSSGSALFGQSGADTNNSFECRVPQRIILMEVAA